MKTYEYWLKYYEYATKEHVIEDSMHDIEEITKLQQENKELKEKIDKAIEHIKKYQYWNGDNYNCLHCEELLEILGDKE